MSTAVYDRIGKTYDATRRADPDILRGLLDRVAEAPGRHVLDVGCGSGNYTIALHEAGFDVEGLDLSEEMLSKARAKAPQIRWHSGDARRLPFPDESFDAVTCVLATHHIKGLAEAFAEIARVLRPGGRFVTFTSTPAQISAFWLTHYLPTIVQGTAVAMTPLETLETLLAEAGLAGVGHAPFVVGPELQDYFLHGGKHYPERFLDPVVRAGISTFALAEGTEELHQGLARLEADIRSGAVWEIIRAGESPIGDFMHVWAGKPGR